MHLNGEIECIPRLGMEFQSEEEAWQFWNKYAGRMGFSVRRQYSHKSRVDSVLTSSVFVCTNGGFRKKDKRDDNTKNPRAETRTGCKARLNVKFIRETNNFKVVDFVSDHNHQLQKPEACYMLRSQREVSEVAQYDIDLANESGIRPKQGYELMGRQVGGHANLPLTITDYRNYLRDQRRRIFISGEAVAMLNYFNERTLENPSFHHVEQVDECQEITNIFWADARMIADYARFGDVVAFDTTFGTNKEHRPFGVFVGFNHFREIVIFGATLMYDQSEDSFAWVFKAFLEAHNSKGPRTIFTDQDRAMGNAIKTVMLETTHGLCSWHIMENAKKHLSCYNKNELNVLGEFSACMYEYEDESEFEEAFSMLAKKVSDNNDWLPFIYGCKEKWAYCYMKNALSLGMRSTQLSESINGDIKSYLNSDLDIISLFKNFERIVDEKRRNEDKSEFEQIKKQPKIKVNVPILQQVGTIYTPKIFALFQGEYELSWAAHIEGPTNNEFMVATWSFDNTSLPKKYHKVVWDSANLTVSCGCRKYERMGILCWHALKVLNAMNIKFLPEKYILKRWTREAREGTILDRNGRSVIEDTRLEMTRRNRDLCRRFTKIASQAAHAEELTIFVDGALETIEYQLQEKMRNLSITVGVSPSTSPMPTFDNQLRLKKKDGKKCSKRTQSRVETVRKKIQKKTARGSKIPAKAEEIGEQDLNPTMTNNSQVPTYVSYTKLLMESSSITLPNPYFENISTDQNHATHKQEMPPIV